MTDKKDIETVILNLQEGVEHYFNMFQGGGAMVRMEGGKYVLYEIPLYGGEERYEGEYDAESINELITKALSWT